MSHGRTVNVKVEGPIGRAHFTIEIKDDPGDPEEVASNAVAIYSRLVYNRAVGWDPLSDWDSPPPTPALKFLYQLQDRGVSLDTDGINVNLIGGPLQPWMEKGVCEHRRELIDLLRSPGRHQRG